MLHCEALLDVEMLMLEIAKGVVMFRSSCGVSERS